MALYLVTHNGGIEWPEDSVIAEHLAGDSTTNRTETLADLTPTQADVYRALPGVEIKRAKPGRFEDDATGSVMVRSNGSFRYVD